MFIKIRSIAIGTRWNRCTVPIQKLVSEGVGSWNIIITRRIIRAPSRRDGIEIISADIGHGAAVSLMRDEGFHGCISHQTIRTGVFQRGRKVVRSGKRRRLTALDVGLQTPDGGEILGTKWTGVITGRRRRRVVAWFGAASAPNRMAF